MRSGLGTIGEGGSDVVDDRLFGRADKPCRAHDDLNDVHGSPGALVQVDAEVAGEVVEDQVAAIERLQHQDLSDRGRSFARRRPEQQPTRHSGEHRMPCCTKASYKLIRCLLVARIYMSGRTEMVSARS